MGQGIKLGGNPPELEKAIEEMRDQMLILWVMKSNGRLVVPIREIDATGSVSIFGGIEEVNGEQCFVFTARKKQ